MMGNVKWIPILYITSLLIYAAKCYPVQLPSWEKPENQAQLKMTADNPNDPTTVTTGKPNGYTIIEITKDAGRPQEGNGKLEDTYKLRMKATEAQITQDVPTQMPGELSSVSGTQHEPSELFQELAELSKESNTPGERLFEGDIKLTPEQWAALQSSATAEAWNPFSGKKWPTVIPYTMDRNIPFGSRSAIIQSMEVIKQHTCLRFVERTSETNYMRFFNGNGCSSSVGMQHGPQRISISYGCTSLIPAHEIFHALGRWHEQSRPDRDNFVTINWSNIQSSEQHNFHRQGHADVQGIPYDYDSIMHYDAYAFARDSWEPTIEPKDPSISLYRLGQRNKLSSYDIMHVNLRYCPGHLARLVNGTTQREGRVEISINAEWGSICDDYFDYSDATVVCKFLGFPGALSAESEAHYGEGSGNILLDDLSCDGYEASPFHCPHRGFGVHNCEHYEDAGVECKPPPIRLADGRSNREGRVEVFLHGEWGTVCDDDWDINSAHVVCQELGFGSASATYGHARFGEGEGQIWMDDMRCSGKESHLIDCPQSIIGNHDCRHSEDVSVICSGSLAFTD